MPLSHEGKSRNDLACGAFLTLLEYRPAASDRAQAHEVQNRAYAFSILAIGVGIKQAKPPIVKGHLLAA
jgi:hypothetical protein